MGLIDADKTNINPSKYKIINNYPNAELIVLL